MGDVVAVEESDTTFAHEVWMYVCMYVWEAIVYLVMRDDFFVSMYISSSHGHSK